LDGPDLLLLGSVDEVVMSTSRKQRCGKLAVTSFLRLAALTARAGTVAWDNGGADNVWSTANNWSGAPDDTEPAIAAGAASDAIALTGQVALNGATLTVSGTPAAKAFTLISGLRGSRTAGAAVGAERRKSAETASGCL
jgi:hypothetical protein